MRPNISAACGEGRARPRRRATIALAALLSILGCSEQPASTSAAKAPAATITVFAAASTVDVMNQAARLFKDKTGIAVKCSFDASSTLGKQIIAGAPADVYVSADEKWMDEVEKASAIDPATRMNLLGNALVLIVPLDKSLEVRLERGFDFSAALPANARFALADPTHVPAGRYAKQSLEWLGWWAGVEQRVVTTQDVRAALRLVESGEADAGIVYATDAKASKNVRVVATFPVETHEPVRYPAAITTIAKPQAADFVAFLQSDAMQRVFEDAGFSMLTEDQ